MVLSKSWLLCTTAVWRNSSGTWRITASSLTLVATFVSKMWCLTLSK